MLDHLITINRPVTFRNSNPSPNPTANNLHKKSVLSVLSILCVALLVIFANQAFAQVDQGTITGVVQDSSGAVIPGADVTLTNTDDGFVLRAKSNGSGVFVFSPIKIGHYTVSASAANFETTRPAKPEICTFRIG